MYTILIVEDDVAQLDALALIIKGHYNTKFNILKAESYELAIKYINKYTIDIFILDVDLAITSNDNNGLMLGTYIRELHNYLYAPIILITSVSDIISDAIYELHCYSYIIKPYKESKIKNSINSILKSPLIKEFTLNFHTLFGIGITLKESDIFYIEASIRCINIHFIGDVYQTSDYTLEQLSSNLTNSFIRCHRKYIVNINYATKYNKTHQKLECDNNTILVGRAYKKEFEKSTLHFIYNQNKPINI